MTGPESKSTGRHRQREVITYGGLAAILLSQAGYLGKYRTAGLALALGTYAIALWALDAKDLFRSVAE
jgi:uncharacterized membrane protein YebE (DUF533 family)